MSIVTRIRRPTTATSTKPRTGRYLWVSTPVGHMTRQERRNMIGFSTGLTAKAGRNLGKPGKAGRKVAKRLRVKARLLAASRAA